MASKVAHEKKESSRQRDRNNYVHSGMKIGAPGDRFEQEADAVAKKVVMPPGVKVAEPMTTPAVNSAGNMAASQVSDLQMKCEDCENEDKIQLFSEPGSFTGSSGEDEEGEDNGTIRPKSSGKTPKDASSAVSDAIRQSSGKGKPLDPATREEMGSKIGADFRDVKIHTDQQAEQMNRDLGAKAFTHGQDIYFNQGNYNPDKASGKKLLAHELTHTIQQNEGIRKQEETSDQIPEKPKVKESDTFTPDTTKAKAEHALKNKPIDEQPVVVLDKDTKKPAVNQDAEGRPVKEEKEETKEVVSVPTGFENVTPEDNPVAKEADKIKPENEIQLPQAVERMGEGTLEEVAQNGEADKSVEETEKPEEENEVEPKETGVVAEKATAMESAIEAQNGLENAGMLLEELMLSGTYMQRPSVNKMPKGEKPDKEAVRTPTAVDLSLRQSSANDMANSFLTTSVQQTQDILTGAYQIMPRLQMAAEGAKGKVRAAVGEQQLVVTEAIKAMKQNANAISGAALASVEKKYGGTVSSIKKATNDSRDKVNKAYEDQKKNIDTYEEAQFPLIKTIYADGAKAITKAGTDVGNLAYDTQSARAIDLMRGVKNESDGVLDGPLTYNRALARRDAAKAVGDGYKKGISEEGEKQAEKLLDGEGYENDVKNVKKYAVKSRTALDSHYKASLEALDKGEEKSLEMAEKTFDQMSKAIRKAQWGTLKLLESQEKAQLDMLAAFGERQEAAIDRDMYKSVEALTNGVIDAVGKISTALRDFRDQTMSMEAPETELLQATLDTLSEQISASIISVVDNMELGVSASEKGISDGSDKVVEGLGAMSAKGIKEAADIHSNLSPVMQDLRKGAAKAFDEGKAGHNKSNKSMTDSALDGIKTLDTGIKEIFKQLREGLTKGLKDYASSAYTSFHEAVYKGNAMLNKSVEEEDKAAAKVKPRWKKVLKVLLIIAVIVVVALVVGPAVIGFVAGAAGALGAGAAAGAIGAIVGGAVVGAAAGAVIQMGSNLIDGEPVMQGVFKAAVVGAIGGALGGAGGALGQFLTKGLSGAVPALSRFGVDMAFDIGGGVLGDLAVGNPITVEGILMGAAMSGGISVSMGGLSSLKGTKLDIGGFATKSTGIQTKFQMKGTAMGGSFGAKVKSKFKAPEVPISTPKVPKIETPPAHKTPKTEGDAVPKTPKEKAPKGEVEAPKTKKPETEPPKASKPEADAPKKGVREGPAKPNGEAPPTPAQKPKSKLKEPAPGKPEPVEGGVAKSKSETGHDLTVMPDGTIVRCSAFCTSLKNRYKVELDNPKNIKLKEQMAKIDAMPNGKAKAEAAAKIEAELAKVKETGDVSMKRWDDPTLTKQEMIADYRAVNTKSGLTDAEIGAYFDKGMRVNPKSNSFKKPLPEIEVGPRADLPKPGTAEFNKWMKYDLKGDKPVCFPPKTLVKTADGEKRIENIKAGQSLLSYNQKTGFVEKTTVRSLLQNWALEIITVKTENAVISSTLSHPYWVGKLNLWIAASELKKGMLLTTIDGKKEQVLSIEREITQTRTYNFELTNFHNYFVGVSGILVHNSDEKVSKFSDTNTYKSDIYILKDPRTGKVLYVGQTIQGTTTRLNDHINSPDSALNQYLKGKYGKKFTNDPAKFVNDNGGVKGIFIVENPVKSKMLTPFELSVLEQHYINKHGGKNGLLNKIDAITLEKFDQYKMLHNPCR